MSAAAAARRAEAWLPEDGWKRVWITSRTLPAPLKAARLAKQQAGVETLERLLRWPALTKGISLPCYIYSRRRQCFLHEDGWSRSSVQWVRQKAREPRPQYPVPPYAAGNWEPDEALKLARKLDRMDEIELHQLF